MTAKGPGVTAPDGSVYVALTDGAGTLEALNVTVNASDIQIGAIELKNSTTDDRATVSAAGALKVDASSVAVPVTDNSGSLTVDAPVGTPAFVRLSDGSSAITTLPVSVASIPSHAVTNAGTFAVQSAATQSGTWTVQPGNTANTTAWKVDGSAVTQPVSVASIPSHAVTNAGTFAVQATLTAETTKVIGTVNVAASQTIATTNAGTFAVQNTAVQPAAQTYTGNVNTQGTKATYRAVTLAPAIDAAGVLFQMQGSASKTIRITKITLGGVLTVTSNGIVAISKYTTAASGGTSAAVTGTPLDSASSACTAVMLRWTAVPTAGTPVTGQYMGVQRTTWTADTTVNSAPAVFRFGEANGQALVLRGTAEYMTVGTLSFGSYTGSSYTLDVEWTEE